MHHPVFCENEWQTRFTDLESAPDTFFSYSQSPINILNTNSFRNQIRERLDFGPMTPVDIFTFGKGEGDDRLGTKVGGLPYRHRDNPWPIDETGTPYAFLAQFCFADSQDIVGELPGDVLLLFLRTSKSEWDGHDRSFLTRSALWEKWDRGLIFEWQKNGIASLLENKDLAVGPENLRMPTCYGVRYRTTDYVDSISAVNNYLLPNERSDPDTFLATHAKFVWPMMKIGGTPILLGDLTPRCPGRFIAGFGGVAPMPLAPYPWTNVHDPLSLELSVSPENMLLLGDPGYLNIYLNKDGRVDYQFYYKY